MAEPAEQLQQVITPEITSRQTDDIAYNVFYLAEHCVDREKGLFELEAEEDAFEQDLTDLAEADIHSLAPIVRQRRDNEKQQYISMGRGTIDNTIIGLHSLDMDDPDNHFEFYRRVEEITEEVSFEEPEQNKKMRNGGKKIIVSAGPTHQEVDPDVAIAFNYDDRTMLRIQSLSKDARTKSMQSFSIFGVTAQAWANFLGERYEAHIEPTALAVMRFCNQMDVEYGTNIELVETFINGVMKFVNEEERQNLQRQLDAFKHDQAELEAQATYYAKEKQTLEKELALSLNDWARPQVAAMIRTVWHYLKPDDKEALYQRFHGNNLYVDDFVVRLALSVKIVTLDNRAGLASHNERTVQRVASSIGLENTILLAERERAIQQIATSENQDFMIRRNEQLIVESGVGCGGGCSVSVVDLFSREAQEAAEAGLTGTLYSSKELDKNSKCNCAQNKRAAKVLTDGSNVVCVTCGEFEVKGRRGKLNKAA